MPKKYIEIKFEKKTVAVCPIKECEPLEYIELEKEATKNFLQLYARLKRYDERIDQLEKDIKLLKGED